MQGKGSVLASCQRQNLFQARAKPLPYMTEQVHAAPPVGTGGPVRLSKYNPRAGTLLHHYSARHQTKGGKKPLRLAVRQCGDLS